jgi:hypothetical protein
VESEDRFRAAAGEDELVLETLINDFDRKEWQW